MGENSCCMTSGKILGKKLSAIMKVTGDLESFMEEFSRKGRGYFSKMDYEIEGDECILKVYRSSFWNVIDGTAIDKIKNVGCLSENRFLEHALKGFFQESSIEKINCHREGSNYCEFLIKV